MAANVKHYRTSFCEVMNAKAYDSDLFQHDIDEDLSHFYGAASTIEKFAAELKAGDEIKVARGYVMEKGNKRGECIYRRCRVAAKYPRTVLLEYNSFGRKITFSPSYIQLYFMMNGEAGEIDG